MVIQSLNGIYLHCAWATSDRGDDFSLVEFADATYCGTYSDNSSTESTEPKSYKWMLIGDISGADNGTDEAINVENATILANQQASNANAQTIVNNDNIQASQDDTDMSTGNPNELIGTNQGTNNWTASAGLTISAQSGTIYNDTADVINYLHVVCNTAGSNYIAFDASALRDKLAELTDDNSFTLSADINMSTVFEMSVMVSDTDGSNIQIDFGTIEPELIPVPEETADGLWVFNKSTADCENEVAVSSQVVLFDLTNMGAGETLDIANLKIEGGALATPWRASLDEVANIANQAYSVASNTEQHFWFQSTGLDTGAHITEVDKDTWDLDPSNGGGNLLARSNGVAIRDGLTELATLTTSGAVFREFSANGYSVEIGTTGLSVYKGATKVAEISMYNNGLYDVTVIDGEDGGITLVTNTGGSLNIDAYGNVTIANQTSNAYIEVAQNNRVNIKGDVYLQNGDIYAKGHGTPIGYNNTGSGTKNNFPNNSQTELVGGISVTPGTWLLVCRVGFPTSTTGRRFACWHNDTTAADYYTSYCTSPPASGGYTNIQTIMTIQVSANTTFSVHAFQNSGSSMNVAYNWSIVRIA